ncbi:MAG: efflux transporter outer membrane subunit, partial [Perlucidibaca sp.]
SAPLAERFVPGNWRLIWRDSKLTTSFRFQFLLRRFPAWAMLALAACSGLPQRPAEPALMTPAALSDDHALTDGQDGATQEWPGAGWWRSLADPQLDALVGQALQQSPSLAQARARLDQALAATGIARSALLPQAALAGKLSYERFTELQFIPPPYGGNRFWNNEAMLQASLDLDVWGRHHESLAAARDISRMVAAEADEAREVLLATLAHSYVQLALQQALSQLLRDTLAAEQDIVGLARQRLHAGLGTELDLARAESRLPSTQAELDEVDGAMAVTRLQLVALTGQGPEAASRLQAPVLALTRQLPVPESLPARWLGRRPDVRARRWQVEALSHEVEAARRAFYPDVNLSAFAGHVALGLDNIFTRASTSYGIAPAISLPLFEGGRLQAGLDTRLAQREAAVASYNETLLKAAQQVVGLSSTLKSLNAQATSAAQAVTLASRADALARRGLHAGLSDQAQVLDTELSLLAERRRLLQVRARWLDAYIELARATGAEHDDSIAPGRTEYRPWTARPQ